MATKTPAGFPDHDALRTATVRSVTAALDRSPALVDKPKTILTAVRARRADVLELLLDRGADVDALHRGYRPLHATIQREPHTDGEELSAERLACFEVLLARGADPELPAAWPPVRATILAALSDEPELLRRLLAHGARTDALVDAVRGRTEPLRALLARDPAFATRAEPGGLLPLHAVAGSRLRGTDALLAAATALLDAGADPNALVRAWSNDVDPAYFAVHARHAAMLDLLLARGGDANRALASALWIDPEQLATIALRHGADPDVARIGPRPLLNELVRWGQVGPVLWLLAQGASADVADAEGWTALHQAASRGNERMLRAMLDAGADRTTRDGEGRTPLDVARSRGRARIMALLQGDSQ